MTAQEVADGITEFYGHEENAKYRGHLPPARSTVEVGGKTWHIGRWFHNLSREGVKRPLPGVVVTALGAAGIKISGNESTGFTIDARAHGAVTAQEIADGITEFYGHEENAKYRGHLPPQRAVIEVGDKTWHIGPWFHNLSRRGVKGPLPGVVVTALGAAGIKIRGNESTGFTIDARAHGAVTAQEVADGISKFYGHEENAKYRGHLPPQGAVVEVGGKIWRIGRWFETLSRQGVKRPLPDVVATALKAAGISIIDHPDRAGFVKTNKQTQRKPVAEAERKEAMRQYLLNHLPIAPSRGYAVVLEGTDTAISVGQHWDDLRNRGWVASQAGGHAGERAVLEAAGFTFVEVSVPVKEGG
ncbi:hypothetical protein ACIOWI_38040, partial [Streptomyces sp. NPDC087659]|uniref:hypothetical protein n=1 Tax=Streptomyces sp. NPDC087659 TaxID=3365801 RepID=UPI0038129826